MHCFLDVAESNIFPHILHPTCSSSKLSSRSLSAFLVILFSSRILTQGSRLLSVSNRRRRQTRDLYKRKQKKILLLLLIRLFPPSIVCIQNAIDIVHLLLCSVVGYSRFFPLWQCFLYWAVLPASYAASSYWLQCHCCCCWCCCISLCGYFSGCCAAVYVLIRSPSHELFRCPWHLLHPDERLEVKHAQDVTWNCKK